MKAVSADGIQGTLEFVLSATFVALVVPGLSDRRELAAVVAGAAVALAGLGSTVTLGVAALVGWAIGATSGGNE